MYNKSYSSFEEKIRKEIFQANFNIITQHNHKADNGIHNYWLKVNKFADFTEGEYMNLLSYRIQSKLQVLGNSTYYANDWEIPDSVDWREKEILSDVRDQISCGSDWATVAVTVLESQIALAKGNLTQLSRQQLIDCSLDYRNLGCQGGATENAFKYMNDAGGIDSEQSYPYIGHQQTCQFDRQKVQGKTTGFVVINSQDDTSLKDAIANVGPIASVMDGSPVSFQFYSHGIYDSKDCSSSHSRVNHAVTIIGYGVDNGGKPFWLIQNSWGTDWGESGIMKLARENENQCGIANFASYPLI